MQKLTTRSGAGSSFPWPAPNSGKGRYSVGVHDGQHNYCDATFFCICQNGKPIVPGLYPAGRFNTAISGDVVIGSSVPEPGTLALLGGGLVAVVGVVRRRLNV